MELVPLPDTDAVFGFSVGLPVKYFPEPCEHVPEIDAAYMFDPSTTRAILAGFLYNRRVLVSGFHGTGKSTHIEQVSARLNWPCIRINLDSHISRIDLLGKDAIIIEDGKQITAFRDGILPWALKRNIALVFDEYDAGRPDVMFVIQRILEHGGRLTLLDQSTVIMPHPQFRLFATANTVGLGDSSGLYHGTSPINQGQMDRWSITATLNFLPVDVETRVICSKLPSDSSYVCPDDVRAMVQLAGMTRAAFKNGEISTLMSPRTVLTWVENTNIFRDTKYSFIVTFLNRCDETEHGVLCEFYQRCFGETLPEPIINQAFGTTNT